jgi:hypothetical protein
VKLTVVAASVDPWNELDLTIKVRLCGDVEMQAVSWKIERGKK